MHRLFVALRPPPSISDALLDLAEGDGHLRWTPEEQLHLTLKFIGEVERPQAEDIAAALSGLAVSAVELRLAGVGLFERRSGGVLWAGVEPRGPVAALAAKVDRACQAAGVEPDHRAFHPHLTLAGWSGGRPPSLDSWLADHRGLTSPPFRVDAFTLFESHLGRHGARHVPVLIQPLVGSGPEPPHIPPRTGR